MEDLVDVVEANSSGKWAYIEVISGNIGFDQVKSMYIGQEMFVVDVPVPKAIVII